MSESHTSETPRSLADHLAALPARLSAGLPAGQGVRLHNGAGALIPERLVEDARLVGAGDVFLARAGAAFDGRTRISDAMAAGAVAVLTDHATAAAQAGPAIGADDPECVGALLAHALVNRPSHYMHVVGITGTNGKSTCAMLLQHVLAETGYPCGLVGGISTWDGHAHEDAVLTTPAACVLANLLGRMRRNGCSHVSMEVSSQGIATGRLEGAQFAAGVFTNLSGDHLDLHGDLETYGAIKGDWITGLESDAPRIINIDDAFGAELAARCPAEVITCGADGVARVDVLATSLDGQRLAMHTPWGDAALMLPLIGTCNAINALQVAVTACALGCDLAAVAGALERCRPPRGRLQLLEGPAEAPRVMVDFAHTDGALEAALMSLRPVLPAAGRLIVVVGCGGDRDETKRPRMGRIAASLGDQVWLTSDNPRSEDPERIIDMMAAGVAPEHRDRVHRDADRRGAIAAALDSAAAGDLVVIAGKGHESVQVTGDRREPFDDALVAQAQLGLWSATHA